MVSSRIMAIRHEKRAEFTARVDRQTRSSIDEPNKPLVCSDVNALLNQWTVMPSLRVIVT